MAEDPDAVKATQPELTTLRGNQVTVETLEKLCIRLTGQRFTPEERKEAEEIAAEYAAAIQSRNDPDRAP